jgi:putative transposase
LATKGGETMPGKKHIISREELKKVLGEQEDFLRPLVQKLVQEVLEAEMEESIGAAKGERTATRLGYRSGYYSRSLMTRIGKLELRVPQDRQGRFSTEVFERYQRSEKALVSCLAQMYVQGVSTRKVKAVAEELCGHGVSASTISEINKKMDEELERFSGRELEEEYPYLVLDARYEKVRQDGVIRAQAVLIGIGINWDGRRQVLGVDLANRESNSSWKEFLLALKRRGLRGVELVISDDHQGLKKAIMEIIPEACWQRCYVHFMRNALDHLPRKADDDCLRELRWLYDRKGLEEARQELRVWLKKWEDRYPKLCEWVEENIEETFTFYRWPRAHHKHIRSTNMLERINEEIKRRTYVIRIFPNEDSCLRLIRALLVEINEDWIEQHRYLNMELLKEHYKRKIHEMDNAA